MIREAHIQHTYDVSLKGYMVPINNKRTKEKLIILQIMILT